MSGDIQQLTATCRLCTAMCPTVVTVEDGRVTEVHGDRGAPLYEGYTCPKGRAQPEMLADPNRLLSSLKRRPDGSHEPIPSDQAIAEIAERLAAIVDRHGPSSVAMYVGTLSTAHPAMATMAGALMGALRSSMLFSAATIDQPGVIVADALHGVWLGGRIPFDAVDAFLFMGTNPVISHQWLGENPAKRLARAVERGTKIVVVDPRRTETARRADIHLQARPGTDVEILAGLVHVILREGLIDEAFIGQHVRGLDELRDAVEPFTPDRVARRADISPDDLVAAARILGHARRGGVGGGTGMSMGNAGTLAYYLMHSLMSVRGFWPREGDPIARPHVLLPPNHAKAQALGPYRATSGQQLRVRGLGGSAAGLPTTALAEEILLEGDGQIRALFNVGGSPAVAWPDQRRTRQALEDLDLFVTTEVGYSPTARLADYVVATKMALETPGLTYVPELIPNGLHPGYGFSEPYAQYSPAIVDPPAGADLIEDWQLYYRIAQRLGLPLSWISVVGRPGGHLVAPISFTPLDMEHEPTTDELYEIMCKDSHVPLAEVKRHPHGHVFEELKELRIAPPDPGDTDRLDVGNREVLATLEDVLGKEPVPAGPGGFLLTPRRENRVVNSNGRSLPGLMRGRHYNPAFMHPDDLAMLGVVSGDLVEIRSAHDVVTGVAEPDPDLRRGVMSMSHSFGANPGEDEDPRADGANTNRLLRVDDDVDPFTGMPRMGALSVTITPVSALQPI